MTPIAGGRAAARWAVFGVLSLLAACPVPGAEEAEGGKLVVPCTLSFDGGVVELAFDLPEGTFEVRPVIDLGGREPRHFRPQILSGDAGTDVGGGVGKRIRWSFGRERRLLSGREQAWVVAIPEALGRPVLHGGPLEGMAFVVIPEGAYRMGSPEGERGRRDNEGPQREQTLESFEMSTTEIRQRHFEQVMGFNPSKMKGPERPVERVSLADALEFCRILSERDPQWTYRLPTEVEWEYACRAGLEWPYWWDRNNDRHLGVAPEGNTAMAEVGWCSENASTRTHDVGGKLANGWGLQDMHGNVWEWCLDAYAPSPAGAPAPFPAEAVGAAAGVAAAAEHVVRGGSWRNPAADCRSARRDKRKADETSNDLGFRVVRVRR